MDTTTSTLIASKSAADPELSRLRSDIAQTRADMGNTIEALHGRLNPTVLKEQALDQLHEAKETIKADVKAEIQHAKSAVREATIGRIENMIESAQTTVRDTSRSFMDTIRENPIPAALAGFGLAWLFMSRSRRRQDIGVTERLQGRSGDTLQRVGARVGELAERAQSTLGEATRDAGEAVSAATRNAGEAVSKLAQNAGEAVTHFAQDAGESVTHLAHDAKEQGRRLENRVESFYYENPLAVGAAVVAAGTVIGLAIPISRKEDEWMGKARDEVVQKAQNLAREAIGKAEDVGKDVVEAFTTSDEAQGGERQAKPGDGEAQRSVQPSRESGRVGQRM